MSGQIDYDAIRKEVAEINQSRENSTFKRLKLVQGKNAIRILPPKADGGAWFVRRMQHWGIVAPKRPMTCAKSFNEECYACGVVQVLRDKGQNELAGRWKANIDYIANGLVMTNADEVKKGVQLVQLSRKAFGPVLEMIDGPYRDLLDVDKGRIIIITVRGEGFEREYTVYPDGNDCPVKNWDEVSNQLYDLQKLVKPVSEEQMKEAVGKALSESAGVEASAPTAIGADSSTNVKADLDSFLADFEKKK